MSLEGNQSVGLPFLPSQMGSIRGFFAFGEDGTVYSATSKPAAFRFRETVAWYREPAMARSPPGCSAS